MLDAGPSPPCLPASTEGGWRPRAILSVRLVPAGSQVLRSVSSQVGCPMGFLKSNREVPGVDDLMVCKGISDPWPRLLQLYSFSICTSLEWKAST